ncbi:MAG TPA: putative glycolipid-binding domain-containing protein [Rhodothermales bacterium]|nr:putative glycolipid-binding domain-containing protein [Rhodothermales bacterium]
MNCYFPVFLSALVATGPSPALPPDADIYAPLLGSWVVEVVDYEQGGARYGHGEWHFARVLEGRAVQDAWIVPPRSQRTEPLGPGNRYGSSLRVYDAARGRWEVIWVNPVSGAIDRLVARREGADIIHEGGDTSGNQFRWTFTDITPESFRWMGEASADEGRTWQLEAEFHARRLPAPSASVDHPIEVLWSSLDGYRLEHVRLIESTEGFVAEGVILRRESSLDLRVRYRISGDAEWRVREVVVGPIEDNNSESLSLHLRSDGRGRWWDAGGSPRPELEGAVAVDLHASPFTNTIAIRRLALVPGAAAVLDVAFVDLAPLGARLVRQRYLRLTVPPEGDRYRYEGLETGFTVELPVDAHGLLIEYPGYFRRVWEPR